MRQKYLGGNERGKCVKEMRGKNTRPRNAHRKIVLKKCRRYMRQKSKREKIVYSNARETWLYYCMQ